MDKYLKKSFAVTKIEDAESQRSESVVVAESENAERERTTVVAVAKSMLQRSHRKCISTLSTQSLAFAAWWA